MVKFTRWIMVLVFGLAVGRLAAQSDLSTRDVSIFKDGTAFFVRSGKVPVEDKQYSITQDQIPKALYGTLWFHAADQPNFSVRAIQDTVRKERKFHNQYEMLQVNEGKNVRLLVEEEWYEGKLIQVSGALIVVKTNDGYASLPLKQIKQSIFLGEPKLKMEDKKLEKTLQLSFDKAVDKQAIEMMYLSRGISWFPSYLIELTEEEKARLTFRAEIANDAEDLEDARINFVVGVPNFRYAGKGESPLVSTMNVDQILGWLAAGDYRPPAPVAQVMSNRAVSYSIDAEMDDAFTPMPVNTAAEGSSLEDLYFYNLENISLPKGGRAYYHILTTDVPVAHIYESEVPSNQLNRSFYARANETDPVFYDVIHKLKLKNVTDQPLTTGPAFVSSIVDGTSQPVSQDQLKYTPPEGEVFIKITQAPDIRVSHQEEEVEVQTNAKRKRRVSYDLVTVQGTVHVKNFRNKTVDLNVRRLIHGNLVSSDVDWLKAPVVDFSDNLNDKTNVCWELNLESGEEVTVQYRYQVYVAS
jgi:hypothetical protein